MNERTIDDSPVLADGVMDAVLAHVGEDLEREVGGILAGRLTDDRAHVELAVPALRAEGHRTNVTFTHDVWEDVLAKLDRDHPELRIVGWYHSHPGFGIFLSEYDQFIQQNFFPAEGMVALVVDPQTGASGWFATRDAATVRVDGGEPVAEPRDRPSMERPAPAGVAGASSTTGSRTRAAGALVVAAALLLGFTGGWVVTELNGPTPVDDTAPLLADLAAALDHGEALEAELADLEAATDALRAAAAADEASAADDEAAAEDRATDGASATEATEGGETGASGPTPPSVVYRVRPGDTLASLAWAFSRDPDYLATLIAANPQLDDPDLITIGLDLTIPPADPR
jgi:proteasome lid subunit RPN8/RPN11